MLPLSVVTEDAAADLPGALEFSRQQATELGGTEFAKEVLAAEYILLGLRYPREFVKTLFQELHEMQESTTYQAILEEGHEKGLEEGREEGLREAILSVGELTLGPADQAVRQSLKDIHDAEQLKSLLRRIGSVANWRDLLSEPAVADVKP